MFYNKQIREAVNAPNKHDFIIIFNLIIILDY